MMKNKLCGSALAGAALVGGCDAPDSIGADAEGADSEVVQEDAAVEGFAEEIAGGSEPAYTFSGWTPWTSEEDPPISCDPGSLVNAFQCSGGWCDNIRMHCAPQGVSAGGSFWTSHFSEEGHNYRECPWMHWISGMACRGGWCDDISLQCTYYPALTPKDCYWTGWVSEESGGFLDFGGGYYARSAQCSGGWCDNLRFYVCRR